MDVAAGETVALVGPSGGGKSTCMGLLLRFYEPAKGSVTIDGRDIKEVNVKWLRSQVNGLLEVDVGRTGGVGCRRCFEFAVNHVDFFSVVHCIQNVNFVGGRVW